MKINSSLLTLLIVILSNHLIAQSIDVALAKKIAENQLLLAKNGNLKSAGLKPVNYRFSSSVAVENRDTLFYTLNDTLNNSFVIVAADRRVWPILAYSLNSLADGRSLPPAFIEWMGHKKDEIAFAKKNNLLPANEVIRQWDNLINLGGNSTEISSSVDPLLKTTWNQGCYYNTLCPADIDGPCDHVWAGCVATSMAQVMRYWSYPDIGLGSYSYQHSTYGTLSADFGATTYHWDQMPNSIFSENLDIATLMYHCGVSVNMNYGPDGSGAGYPLNALVNYFKYASDIQFISKSNYSTTDWLNLLKFELTSNRPIWYQGFNFDSSSGHAFVCDGYQNSDYFHFNWGWGGYADGYFYLNDLIPIPSYNYNYQQGALIKIFPNSLPDNLGAIAGSPSVCKGQTSVVYSVQPIQNAASYIWTLPSGATGYSSTNSIAVNFGINAQSGLIKVKAQNSLGLSNETSLNIAVNSVPGAAGTISGEKIICSGTPVVYSISPVSGATKYLWQLPAGWTGQSTTSSISVVTGSSGGTIFVTPMNDSNCFGSTSTLTVISGEPISPDGATASLLSIIGGQSTKLSVIGGALNSAPAWVWYTGGCGNTIVGYGATLDVSPFQTTTYYVQATGCGISTSCRSVTIDVCNAPSAPVSSTAWLGDPANGENHAINFNVEGVADADGYSWDYSFDGINWNINWFSQTWTSLSLKLSDIPNSPFYLRVRAFKCSDRQYSAYTYTTPKPIYTACDNPALPTISGATINSLKITLNEETPVPNPAITTYSIYCSTTSLYVQSDGTMGNTEVFRTRLEWGTKTITGLSENTQYCFYAKARNGDGDVRYDEQNSACGSTTSSLCVTPGTPLSAIGTPTGQTSAGLSWSAGSPVGSSAVTYYWVIGTSASVIYGNGVTQGTTTQTSATADGLSPGTTYYLRVYAKTNCDGSASAYKTSQAFATESGCVTPGTPLSAIGTPTGQTSAGLSWSAGSPVGSSAVTYYWVIGTSASVIYGNGVTQGTTTQTSATAEGLSPGTTYYLRVYAKTNCDGSASAYKTSQAFATESGCVTPGTPLSAIGTPTGQTSAGLSWSAGSSVGSSAVTYYWVIGTSASVIYGNGVTQGTTTQTSATADGLSPGTTYYLRVYAKTNCDGSASAYKTSQAFKTEGGCEPVSIFTQPASQAAKIGSSASFSVTVNGTPPFNFFWYKNGIQISSAFNYSNTNTYVTPALKENDRSNVYYCVIKNCDLSSQIKSDDASLIFDDFEKISLDIKSPEPPIPTVFTIGLSFNVPVTNVFDGITVLDGKLRDFSGAGTNYSLTISASEKTTVTVILSDAITSVSSVQNKFAGQTLKFTTGDFTCPTLLNWTPNNETIQDNHPTFKMTFDEDITNGSNGLLKVFKVGSNVSILEIPVQSNMFNGKDVVVDYASTQKGLDRNTRYYVLVDGLSIRDKAGNVYEGITDIAKWTFKTGENFITTIDPALVNSMVKIFPNPTTGAVKIENLKLAQKTIIEVYAENGKLILKKITYTSEDKIDLSHQASGTFILFINDSAYKIIKK